MPSKVDWPVPYRLSKRCFAGGGLLRAREDLRQLAAAVLVDHRHEVAAVVHRHLRVRLRGGVEVAVVGVAVGTVAGVHGDPVFGDQRGRRLVLRREGVGGAQDHVRAAGLERPHQVRGLRGDMEAGGDAQPGERLLALEPLADQAEDRHLALGPLDAAPALRGEAHVRDVVAGQVGLGGAGPRGRRVRDGHADQDSLRAKRRRNVPDQPLHGGSERWINRSSNDTFTW